MTQQTINLGTADQGNGDPLRVAFSKVNANFTELYNQVAAGVVVDTVPPSTPGEGDLWWDPESGRLYVSYDSTWVDASPVDGAGISSTDELVNGAYTVSLGSDGNLSVPDRITFSDESWQSTAFIGHAYSLRNNPTGSLYVTLDDSGTINTPLLLPKTFTAVLDPAHYVGEGTLVLEGDAWEYTVQFQVEQDGTVQTMFDNQPWPSNPGYINGIEFEFLEADHGIPDYTFTLTLNSIQNPNPGVYTANPEVSQPPVYPATIQSLGAIKLAANDQSLTFGTNGTITYQGTESDLTFTNQIGMESALIWRGGLGAAINNMETHLVIATNHNNTAVAWQFGHDGETLFPGRLNFSDGSTLGDNILTGAIDSDLGLEIKRIITVSDVAAAGSTTGTLIVDISTNDDITAVLDGWEINAGTGIAPIWMAVTETTVDPGNTYEIVVPEFVFEPGNTYTFRNPTPESKTWFIRNQTGTLVAPGGAILSSETGDLGGGETYRNFAIELPSPDESSEFRWEFDNSGNLITPGNITVTGGLLTTYGTVVDIAWNTDNYIGLHANPNAGVLVRSSDGDLNYSDWKFEVDGTLEIPGGITTGLVPSVGDVVSGVPTWSGQGGTDNRMVFWFDAASIPQLMTLNNFNGGNLVGWTVSVSDGNSSTITAMHPAGFFSIETAVALTGTGDLTFTSPDYVEAYYKNLDLSIASNIWSFRDDGTLIAPSTIAFGDGNRTNINQVNNNFVITTNTGPGDPYSWTFDDTGNLNLPGGAIIDTYDLGAENATYFWGASNKLLAIRAKESDGSPAGGIHVNADGTVEILAQTSQPNVESVTFTFSPNGGLTFPDTSVQTTAYPGTLAAAKLPYYSDTTARDTAIPSPVNGMTVIVGGSLYFYGNSQWLQLAGTP